MTELVIIGGGPAGMSAAVAALICENEVRIKNAEAVEKSYPSFFDVYFDV